MQDDPMNGLFMYAHSMLDRLILAASRRSSPTKNYGGNNQNDYDTPADLTRGRREFCCLLELSAVSV